MSIVNFNGELLDLAGETFEFSSRFNNATGLYDILFLANDEIIAIKLGDSNRWKLDKSSMGLLIEDWLDFSVEEQQDLMEETVENIKKAYAESFGNVSVPDTDQNEIDASPCQALGAAAEALSINKDWADKMVKFTARMKGYNGLRTFGVTYYHIEGRMYLNLHIKKMGLPANYPKQWEPLRMKAAPDAKASSIIAMRYSNGVWQFSDVVLNFFDAMSTSENQKEPLTFEQICAEYPDNIFVKLMSYGN
jgi:hypothetical protein